MSSSRTSKVFALSFGQGLTTLVALISAMVMTRVLSQEELATYRQTFLAYEVAVPLLSLGISSGIYYFLPTEKNRARGLVVDGVLMLVFMGLLYAMFIAFGGNNLLAKRFSNPAVATTLLFLAPLPIFMLPAGLLSSVMVVQNVVGRLTLYNVLASLFMASSVIMACLAWKTPESMVLIRVCVSIFFGLVAIDLMFRAVPTDKWQPSWTSMKSMLTFSIPMVLATALGSISLQLDKIIVSTMCSPEIYAIYSTGAMEIPLIGIITGSIATVIMPDMRRMASEGDNKGALTLFKKGAEKAAVFMIPIMIFLMVSAESFIITLFSAKYSDSILPFRLFLLMLPMRIAYFGGLLMAYGCTKTILYRSAVGLAVNATMSILLVSAVGYWGAIIATIFSLYFVEGTWSIVTISRLAQCRWWHVFPFAVVFKLAGVSVLACMPVALLTMASLNLQPAVQLGLNAIIFVAALVFLSFSLRIEFITVEIFQVVSRVRTRINARK